MTTVNQHLPFHKRAELCNNPTAKTLFHLMEEKETNLAVNADVTTKQALLDFANQVGPHICILKTHVDILEDFDIDFIHELQKLAKSHQFLLFEDRKFADIGTIAKMQYLHGLYKIASWADITNAHILPGPGIIQGLKEAGLPMGRGLLLLAEMSSKGSLATGSYTESAVTMAKEDPDFVIGFITQHRLTEDPRFLHLTPGVKLAPDSDPLGQQYQTPERVIKENGSDIMIVGRGISQAQNPAEEAARYRKAGFSAYYSS